MCRIVLFVLDQPIRPRPVDPKRQSHYLPGDAVNIVDDGVFLGVDIERGHPAQHPGKAWWRIIELPGVSKDDPDLLALLHRDPNHMTDLGVRTWKRSRHIDLGKLKPGHLSKKDVVEAIVAKPSQPRSGVIG